MNKILLFCGLSMLSVLSIANDGTGFVATGGIQYLKNKDIQMYSEDLFISKLGNLKNQLKTLTHHSTVAYCI